MTEPAFDIDIGIEAEEWLALVPDLTGVVTDAAEAALAACASAPGSGELSVLLSGDGRLAELNEYWRGKSGPTNVLSFPGELDGPGPALLGDIALALETVQKEADDAGVSVSDHLSHLVVHGVLHLMGYDHETDHEAEAMERLETEILHSLGIADPYALAQGQVTEAAS